MPVELTHRERMLMAEALIIEGRAALARAEQLLLPVMTVSPAMEGLNGAVTNCGDVLEQLRTQVAHDDAPLSAQPNGASNYDLVALAVSLRCAVTFHYFGQKDSAQRARYVAPVSYQDDHFFAEDLEEGNKLKQFKFDRVKSHMELTSRPAEPA